MEDLNAGGVDAPDYSGPQLQGIFKQGDEVLVRNMVLIVVNATGELMTLKFKEFAGDSYGS